MVHFALPTFAVASALCSLAMLSSTAEAHTVLREPQACLNETSLKKWGKQAMDPIAFLEDVKGFKVEKHFVPWLRRNGYANLRAFMDDKKRYKVYDGIDFDCGWTDVNCRPPKAIPKSGTMRTSGYLHDGPCAVYIDDTLVSSADNCRLTFPKYSHCINYSLCKGSCVLRFFWLGEREIEKKLSWQVYKACVPLTTGGKKVEPSKTCTPIGAAPPSVGAPPSYSPPSPGAPPPSPGASPPSPGASPPPNGAPPPSPGAPPPSPGAPPPSPGAPPPSPGAPPPPVVYGKN